MKALAWLLALVTTAAFCLGCWATHLRTRNEELHNQLDAYRLQVQIPVQDAGYPTAPVADTMPVAIQKPVTIYPEEGNPVNFRVGTLVNIKDLWYVDRGLDKRGIGHIWYFPQPAGFGTGK